MTNSARRIGHTLLGPTAADSRHNPAMENPDDLNRRLMELEIKASYAEDLLEQLNQTIYRQQQQIDLLLREVGGLRQQLPEGTTPVLRSLREDLPPHY